MVQQGKPSKPKVKPSQNLPSLPSANNQGIAPPISLGDILKQNNLPTVYQGKDYSKEVLTGPGGIGFTTGSQVWDAVVQLSYEYPALADIIFTRYGITKTKKPTSAQSANIFADTLAANGNWNKIVSVGEYSTKAALAYNAQQLANQQLAGISSATAGQQANAIDNLYTTIDSWYPGASKNDENMKKFLGDVISQLVTINGDHIVNRNALMDILRGERPSGLGNKVDQQIKADYDKAFPGLRTYNSDPSQVHMSETQYQTYTQSIMNSSTQFGAPMPTAKQIGELLNGHVSATEYQQRIVDVYAAVQNSDQNVKNTLATQYGVTEPHLMDYVMTGNLPAMQRQVASAQIQDYATRVGLGSLGQAGATQLADMAKLASTAGNQTLGYGVGQIESSLLAASRDAQLTGSLPGSNRPTISTTQLIGSQLAGFGGTNQAAEQVQVGRAEQAAAAPFVKGGGYVETSKGVSGVGSART